MVLFIRRASRRRLPRNSHLYVRLQLGILQSPLKPNVVADRLASLCSNQNRSPLATETAFVNSLRDLEVSGESLAFRTRKTLRGKLDDCSDKDSMDRCAVFHRALLLYDDSFSQITRTANRNFKTDQCQPGDDAEDTAATHSSDLKAVYYDLRRRCHFSAPKPSAGRGPL